MANDCLIEHISACKVRDSLDFYYMFQMNSVKLSPLITCIINAINLTFKLTFDFLLKYQFLT